VQESQVTSQGRLWLEAHVVEVAAEGVTQMARQRNGSARTEGRFAGLSKAQAEELLDRLERDGIRGSSLSFDPKHEFTVTSGLVSNH
jgi:hypothetical protein